MNDWTHEDWRRIFQQRGLPRPAAVLLAKAAYHGKWTHDRQVCEASDADLLRTQGLGRGTLEKIRAVYPGGASEPIHPRTTSARRPSTDEFKLAAEAFRLGFELASAVDFPGGWQTAWKQSKLAARLRS